jgi:tyrosyl-tRNA synthetase
VHRKCALSCAYSSHLAPLWRIDRDDRAGTALDCAAMSSLFADLTWRGLVYQMTDPALEQKLDAGGLTAYIGFDPTADSLHAGNLLQLVTLARLQRAGHNPIVLAGGATGMIGDPGGRSAERNLLDATTLQRNIDGILPQLQQFMDFDGPHAARLVNNHDWTAPVSVLDFLREVGKHFTINQLITRESVRARLEDREQGISYTEFSYGLLQAFDYWHLFTTYGCTLQMGASDQWGNIVGGVDLIRRREGKTAYGLCTPLVTKPDGTKFGKSVSGAIWLDRNKTSPYAFYQFFFNTEDVKVVEYLKFFTFLSHDRIDELEVATKDRPAAREAQRVLAEELTKLVHGDDELVRVQRASKALFSEEIATLDKGLLSDVFADAPSATISRASLGQLPLIDLLVETGLTESKSAARQAIQQGGVSLNNRKQSDLTATVETSHLLHDSFVLVRKGKKHFAVARFE